MSERQALLKKAERFIRSASVLAREGDTDSAVSRLYYAMLYAAKALLDAKGLSFAKHQAVIAAFGERFAKTNELDARFHRVLINAFDKRQLGDYLAESGLSVRDVEGLLKDAQAFIDAARSWLNAHGGI